ncbi:MAG: nickel-dependent hydrogenase large subunit [Eubacteriales bacterium]|nr:nickel-dependent hydrogenase large subunit [Eubacteriales bacterium]MDD3199301.1 nickel-dependent hydrogenase large subunit [Eubacteriales bacterium]MDD4121300.1 nickel-dependent hydrogenase large subunit [Eubacteriales bacterium]MDD4629431.1 nickel-dependent hydrogenase large subunit [Eubacteriales bacterium]
MGKRTIIPFGPQHPVLPEPVHLDLVIEDEKVIEAIPSIGFIHRGLEKLVEKKEYTELVYVIERICGICSFGHGWGYCHAVESLMNIEIPERANYLRTIWHELSRMHSHMLWLGLLADGFGFESLFMHCWRLREKVLDLFEKTTGGRVIFSVCKVGGVRKDIDKADLKEIVNVTRGMEKEFRELADTFMKDYSVKNRLAGIGVLSKEDALELCTVGPMARASGVYLDMRLTGHGVYDKLGFEPCIETAGDCYARCIVRIREIYQSIDLISKAAEMIPDGEIAVPVKGNLPKGEFIARLEQPRGECFYYAKGADSKFLERFRVRTPTNINLPALVKILQGCDLADVPMLILTIDPCISCTER